MGVQGLWELLAPVGRRVSVETLAGKKLAIDASIWMIQFMKAMRDERGEMVRNAHLLGFFRRICKLLFLRTKPVFVFDGGTPALKRRTVAARRRHRDNARAKIRKTAEKLLLNHLKSKRLEELAEEIKSCKSGSRVESKGKQVASSGDNEELANAGILKESRDVVDRTITHESLDQMLAASLAAEEEGKLIESDLMPSGDVSYEEEGGVDEDEEMIFHVNSGTIDPAVLASLPPSMQLDLLDQMRERLMAENRQKYQKFKKMPAKFSELQIQSYLKTVAFRREIDEVQKCATGRGVGGIQTSRIASEANREYIFSSSFTGDKQMLTSTGVAKCDSVVNQEMEKTTALDIAKGKLFRSPSKTATDFGTSRTNTEFAPDVETYLDDRGRVRVSKVRGLGIRMTRDLQRNLDLMKEYEQLLGKKDSSRNPKIVFHGEASDFSKDYSETNCIPSPSIVNEENNSCTNASIADDGTSGNMKNSLKSTTGSVSKAAIEICFTEDEIGTKNLVDNFFFNLVAGDPTSEFFPGSTYFEKNGDHSESECIWEDGMVGEQNISVEVDDSEKPLFVQSKVSEDDEVEWEEGDFHASHLVENGKSVSRGLLEEEANLQEAIRRSLEDIKMKHSSSVAHVEASTMALKDQSSLMPVKASMDKELTLERIDSAAECSSRSNDGLIASDKQHFPSTFVLDGRRDGNAICTDLIISTVSRSDMGLLDELQPMEQSKNEYVENLCKVGSNLITDGPKSKKTADHVVENGLYVDLGTTDNRMGSSLGDCHKDAADLLLAVSLEAGPSISFSSKARSGTDVSLSLIDKTEARIDAVQGLAKNDNYKNPSDGLAFRGQTLMEDEDRFSKAQANFDDEIAFLERERTSLGEEKRRLERNAESVSSEMFAECQELLQMFGLPYIIAPMEAEAQCAYMEMIHLVDGVVTDDSDVFLFGARNVYKNIFDDRKYVETYFMKDIESELGLSRDKLIRMALLLGSDYTEGVSGIGIVNAIEVVNAYPEEDGLIKFREWVESPDPAILGLNGSDSGEKLNILASKESSKSAGGIESNIGGAVSLSPGTTVSDAKKVFMDKHRNLSKNWHFPPSFPSELVNAAYKSPQIDGLTKSFAWGMPDLPLLRMMCWEKFGWPNQKSDQLLVPVLKEYNKHETQLRLEAFYSFNERFAKVRSQRIKKAIKGITGKCSSEFTVKESSSSRRKRGISSFPDEQSHVEKVTACSTTADLKSSKQINGSAESSKQVGGSAKSRSSVNARAFGRGRGRRRGQRKGTANEQLNAENPELNADDESGSTGEMLKSTNVELRRSTRHRKQVSYAEDGAKINKHCGSDQAGNKTGSDQEAATKAIPLGFDGDKLYQEDTILEDHLQSGGGFCPDENESHECQGKEPMIHLVTGGGFCLDEEDSGPWEWSEAKSHGNGDSFKGCEEKLHEELRVSEKGSLGTKRTGENGAAQFSLIPMPSLKRKRRKG